MRPGCIGLKLPALRATVKADQDGITEALDSSEEIKKTRTGGELRKGRPVFQPQLDCSVFPVRTGAGKKPSHIISIGRDVSNDLVIPNDLVTKYHAFFRKREDGRFLLLDGASKNGTFLNDEPVPKWGKGLPVEVESGALIRLGSMEFIFLMADEFRKLVARLFKE